MTLPTKSGTTGHNPLHTFYREKGRKMGHAGAIVGGKDDTASAKKRIMRESGILVVDSPADIGKSVKEILG